MARNKLAGTKNGTSKSALYYQSNPEAKKKKDEYNKKYHSSKYRRMYRSSLNKYNRDNPNSKTGDGKDASHTKKGGMTLESATKNRARNRGKK
jgi:hypothetical protein